MRQRGAAWRGCTGRGACLAAWQDMSWRWPSPACSGGASMPYAAYQFQQIQPYRIPANLIAVPLTALWIMPWGLAALALMPLHLAVLALAPMGWGIAVIVWITARIATWPAAMLRIAPIPDAAILLVTAGLIWLCIWRSAARYA